MADDVPELVVELRKRSARIQQLEGQLVAAKQTPDELKGLVNRVEENARARLHDLRSALAEPRDLREVFLALFPDGLTFTPARTPDGGRRTWKITGTANLHSLVGGFGSDCVATPTGPGQFEAGADGLKLKATPTGPRRFGGSGNSPILRRLLDAAPPFQLVLVA